MTKWRFSRPDNTKGSTDNWTGLIEEIGDGRTSRAEQIASLQPRAEDLTQEADRAFYRVGIRAANAIGSIGGFNGHVFDTVPLPPKPDDKYPIGKTTSTPCIALHALELYLDAKGNWYYDVGVTSPLRKEAHKSGSSKLMIYSSSPDGGRYKYGDEVLTRFSPKFEVSQRSLSGEFYLLDVSHGRSTLSPLMSTTDDLSSFKVWPSPSVKRSNQVGEAGLEECVQNILRYLFNS